MNNFTYHNPVKVVFGLGTLKQAGEEAAKLGKRAFVVSYGDASVTGTLAKLKGLLDAAGVASQEFLEVVPNPPIEMVARGVDAAKAFGSWRSCPTRRSRWSRAAWTRRRRSARTS